MQSGHVYKKVTLVGSSRDGIEDAVRSAVSRAKKSLRNLNWFEVKEIRGWIADGEVQHFQVVTEVGFRLDDEEAPAGKREKKEKKEKKKDKKGKK